ncbi:MAG: hypothetical protein JSW30_06065 [Dehalococcoidia bacterium]|nr:MAG: hypothetical protein JSW30_06065 [Dehalococcoidia bacterium]
MGKIFRLLGGFLLISTILAMNAVPAMATGQPDLEPSQIIATAYTGITNTVTVLVKNNENTASDNFGVLLEAKYGTGDYTTVDNITGNSILDKDNAWYADTQVKFDWTPSTSGDYTLRATVDPGSYVTETNETNNELTGNISVAELTPITVTVRVEGATSTIWSGSVTFSTSSITDKQGTTHNIDHPTALGALAEAASQGGFSYVVSSAWGTLGFVESVDGETYADLDGWKYRVNWVDANIPAVDFALGENDTVLWYYGTWGGSLALRLTADETSLPHTDNFTATVEYYNDDTSSFAPLADATLHAGSRIYTTDASGQVNISLPPGVYTVYADRGDYTEYTKSNQETVIVHVTLTLQPGWNFISMPKKLASDNCTASAVFSGVNTDGHSIFYYTSSGWAAMTADTTVSPLEGIWIYSATTKDLRPLFDPDPRQVPPTKQLSAGWNAIGFSDFTAASANSALTSVEDEWATLIGYDAVAQAYEVSIINNAPASDNHSESRPMYPWKGYWFYMTSNGELASIGS